MRLNVSKAESYTVTHAGWPIPEDKLCGLSKNAYVAVARESVMVPPNGLHPNRGSGTENPGATSAPPPRARLCPRACPRLPLTVHADVDLQPVLEHAPNLPPHN